MSAREAMSESEALTCLKERIQMYDKKTVSDLEQSSKSGQHEADEMNPKKRQRQDNRPTIRSKTAKLLAPRFVPTSQSKLTDDMEWSSTEKDVSRTLKDSDVKDFSSVIFSVA